MSGILEFNFPLFHAVAKHLRFLGHEVFNPAERDNEKYGTDISAGNKTGSVELATQEHGFSLNEALEADLTWICRNAEGVAMLPGWEKSKGATAERALAEALGVQVFYVVPEDLGCFGLFKDYNKAASCLK